MTQDEMVEKYVAQYGEPYRPAITGCIAFYQIRKSLWEEWARISGDPAPNVDDYVQEVLRSVRFQNPDDYYQFPPDSDEEEE